MAGLAIGMILLGMILGVVILYIVGLKSKKTPKTPASSGTATAGFQNQNFQLQETPSHDKKEPEPESA